MKTTTKTTIIRNITAAAALTVVGLAPAAEAAPNASFFRKDVLEPKVERVTKPVLEILDDVNPDILIPLPAPLPFPPIPSVTAKKSGSTLFVTGNDEANDVDIKIDDSGSNRIFVYSNGNIIASYASFPIEKIELNLKGGDDKYFVGLMPGASHKFTKQINLKLGAGDDKGFVDFRGTTWNTVVQGTLKVNVNAGAGDDETIAHFARKHGGKLDFKCQMAAGDDICSSSMWGDVTGGADVKFELFGNGGGDQLWSWNTYDKKDGAYTDIRITGDSTMTILMDGGTGPDILTPTYGGEADGDLTVKILGRSGVDTSNGKVILNNSSSGQIDLKTMGHGGADSLELNVFGSTPYFSAKILGGGGVDTCVSTPNVSKVSCP